MLKRLLSLSICGLAMLPLASCGHEQQLQSISIAPQDTTITTLYSGQAVNLQFTATGTYIHPPETKDITNQVVWRSATPQVVDFVDTDTPGLLTTLGGCGSNLQVTATAYSNRNNPSDGSAISGNAGVNVNISGVDGCN